MPEVVVHTFSPTTWEWQVDFCEFKVSQGRIVTAYLKKSNKYNV